MVKKLILAVAGSGKTTDLINHLKESDKVLIVTYTNANIENIINKIINKFDKIPQTYKIYNYFDFLYNFCFLPFTKNEIVNGYDFKENSNKYLKKTNYSYYKNSNSNRMYSNRLSEYCLNNYMDNIKLRIEKYFTDVYIDEIQDFASHDFDLIFQMVENLNCNFYLYGDFYQHTFDTSRDGPYRKNLFNDYSKYLKEIRKISPSIIIDEKSMSKSKRCPIKVCDFIRNKIKIDIYSFDESYIFEPTLVTEESKIKEIIEDDKIIKLFYSKSTSFKIKKTNNRGNCKGLTYDNVCVVLNKNTFISFSEDNLEKLPVSTKNKFYVACSRCKYKLYFIEESKIINYKKIL